MNQSLGWPLGRGLIRGYALILFLAAMQCLYSLLLTFLTSSNFDPPGELWKVRAITFTNFGILFVVTALLWRYSDIIATHLAGVNHVPIEGQDLNVSFDLGVGLVGLVFFVLGVKGLVGEAAAWYFTRSDAFPYTRPANVVHARDLGTFTAEAVLGLLFFIGPKALLRGILKLRGMSASTTDGAV